MHIYVTQADKPGPDRKLETLRRESTLMTFVGSLFKEMLSIQLCLMYTIIHQDAIKSQHTSTACMYVQNQDSTECTAVKI